MSLKPKKIIGSSGLKNAFLIMLFSGFCWIAASSLIKLPVFLVVSGPCALMALYTVYFSLGSSSDALRDQFADSLYYMGFLMTIASLIASLFSFGEGGRALKGGEVLAQFGIALTTTLLGLTGRIYFAHFSFTVDSAAAEAEASLVGRTNTFIRELEISSEAFSAMRMRFEEQIVGSANHASNLLNSLSDTAHSELKAVASETRADLNMTVSGLNDDLKRSRAAVQNFASKIESIEIPDINVPIPTIDLREVFSDPINATMAAIADLREQVATMGEAAGASVETLAQKINDITIPELDLESSLGEPVMALAAEVKVLKSEVNELGHAAEAATKIMRDAPLALIDLSNKLHQEVDLKEDVAEVRTYFGELSKALEQVGSSIGGLSTHAEKSLEIADGAIMRMASLAESLKQDTEAAANLKNLLAREMEEAAKASLILVKAYRESGEFLLERLEVDSFDTPQPSQTIETDAIDQSASVDGNKTEPI